MLKKNLFSVFGLTFLMAVLSRIITMTTGASAANEQPENTGTAPDKQQGNQASEKTFTQAQLEYELGERIARERAKYADYDELKKQARKLQEYEDSQKTEFQKLQDRIAALEPLETEVKQQRETMQAILDIRLQSVPEQYRDLVPQGTVAQQLDWIEKAQAKGMFTSQPTKTPPTIPPTNGASGEALTLEVIQRLSREEYIARRDEVNAALKRIAETGR